MGLDGVELVMECEDEFGITISDFEAAQTTTVGELAELVIKLLRRKGELEPIQFCESSRLFYQLRTGLLHAGCPYDQIKPSSTIGALLDTPKKVRRSQFAFGLLGSPRFKQSRNDQLIKWGVLPAIIVIDVVVGYYCFQRMNELVAAVCMTPFIITTFIAFVFLFDAKSIILEPTLTLREVLQSALAKSAPLSGSVEELDIRFRVRSIVSEQLAQPIDKVTPHAHFVRDLNMY